MHAREVASLLSCNDHPQIYVERDSAQLQREAFLIEESFL
jgi:hypothetical protein